MLPCWNVKVLISEMVGRKKSVISLKIYGTTTKIQKLLQNNSIGMELGLEIFIHL